MSNAEKEQVFDDVFTTCESDASRWVSSDTPIFVGHIEEQDISHPLDITILSFGSTQHVKKLSNLFDLILDHEGGLDVEAIGQHFKDGRLDLQPAIIQPKNDLPEGTIMQCIIQTVQEGRYHILKHFIFPGGNPLTTRQAEQLCHGDVYCLPYKDNPWTTKKTVQSILARIPGFH
eukprot:12418478-Karenia_brevis.AAC.1